MTPWFHCRGPEQRLNTMSRSTWQNKAVHLVGGRERGNQEKGGERRSWGEREDKRSEGRVCPQHTPSNPFPLTGPRLPWFHHFLIIYSKFGSLRGLIHLWRQGLMVQSLTLIPTSTPQDLKTWASMEDASYPDHSPWAWSPGVCHCELLLFFLSSSRFWENSLQTIF